MDLRISANSEIDFANYYAVELLEKIFGKAAPNNQEILSLEETLKNHNLDCSKFKTKSIHSKILIISPDSVEQNTLTAMLSVQGFQVDHIRNKEDLFKQFSRKSHYRVVIISDQFKDVGFNFLTTYFIRSFKHQRPFLIYLGNDPDFKYTSMGFNARLRHPFFMEDLINLLPKIDAVI